MGILSLVFLGTNRATGEERYMAVSQLCATCARRCFPCWDEPALKAKFTVTLVVPSYCVALNNMVGRFHSGLHAIGYMFDLTVEREYILLMY